MILNKYLSIIDEDDPIKQLEMLGYKNISVGDSKKLIEKELTFDQTPKLIKSFKLKGRKFKLIDDIENMIAQEYAYFKQIVGDVYSDDVDKEDNIIDIPDTEKYKKLFKKSNVILSVFTKEVTKFRKHLDFTDRCELFKELEVQTLIHSLFFYLKLIENLVRNGQIYFMEKNKM